jgi:Glycosyltransferase like family
VIVFGTAVADRATYERVALAGIELAAEPDSLILTKEGYGSIQRAYNEMLSEVGSVPNLEALVLLHEDLELTDNSLLPRVRRLLRDPRVGLIGALGGRNAQLHCWTEVKELYGTAMAPGIATRHSVGSSEVDGVDGSLLVVAPWAVRGLRFSERLAEHFHGYDVDFGLRVKAIGGIVICDDIPYFHHMRERRDYDARRFAGIELARMWDPELRPREWAASFQR